MDGERFEQIQQLFHDALDIQPEQRAGFLKKACGDDVELLSAVLRYLRADESGYSLIDEPLANIESLLESDAGELQAGDQVGNYVIKRLLGAGGMGVVYLAHDPRLERDIAIKLLSTHRLSQPIARERLLHEAKLAATLDHPHIATIYEVGEMEQGRYFIAMAYYDGVMLADRIKSGVLPKEQALKYALQIAKGLKGAHKRNVVHRDIKPANLIITHEDEIKIVDFGIAKVLDQDASGSGQLVGTISYMSPEQAQGLETDYRTDLWSLGVVLFEMVTGKRPFYGEFAHATLYAIIHEEPNLVDSFTDPSKKDILNVIHRLLAKRPEDRYQQADELIADLEHLQDGREISASSMKPLFLGERFPDNLPVRLSSFVGRVKELEDLTSLLKKERLVTITGVGGTGKTRVGVRVGDALKGQFDQGACFIQLSTLNKPDQVISAIAQALNVREMEGVPIKDRVFSHLSEREGMLILDNFEHVIEASPFISELLLTCENLKVLVTSRIPLRIQGEHEYPLSPLRISQGTSVEEIRACEAVQLFEQRARAVKPGFEISDANAQDLSQICERLDGLPLAIELAAARIKVLSPKAILTRLQNRLDLLTGGARDMPDRHRTLREAIAWSYDLLSRPEKQLFQWLSVFVGGFTFDAAEFIFNSISNADLDLFDGLSSLVDKNLVQQKDLEDGESWFYMLETIREFGQECLIAGGDKGIVEPAHCAYFAEFAVEAGTHLAGPHQMVWLDRIEQDHNNLRAAIAFGLRNMGDNLMIADFGIALWRFWLFRGYLVEGIGVLDRIIDHLGDRAGPEIKAKLLMAAGTLAHNFGQYKKALSLFDSCLSIFHASGDDAGLAKTLSNKGWINWRIGNFPDAKVLSEESLWLYQQLNDKQGVATAINNLGWIALYQGDTLKAKEHFEFVLSIHEELNNIRDAAFAKNSVAWVCASLRQTDHAQALFQDSISTFEQLGEKQLTAFSKARFAAVLLEWGDVQKALALVFDEALPLFKQIGDAWGTSFASQVGSRISIQQGDFAGAEQLCKEAQAISTRLGDFNGAAETLLILAEIERARTASDQAEKLYNEALTLKVYVEDKAGQLRALEGLALIAAERSNYERAVLVLGATSALREQFVLPRWPIEEEECRTHLNHIKKQMDEQAYQQAWTSGVECTLEDILKKI